MTDFAVTSLTYSKKDFTTMSAAVGTAIVASQTAVITPVGRLEDLLIEITNTYAGAIVPVVKAGSSAAGSGELSSGIGDLTLTTLANTSGRGILPRLESARFLQANGTLRIEFPASAAGQIMVIDRGAVTAATA